MEKTEEMKLKEHLPRKLYIEFTLPEAEWKKLLRWLNDCDKIEFFLSERITGSKLGILLLNETQVRKWREETH